MPEILPDEMQPAVKHYMPLQEALEIAIEAIANKVFIQEKDNAAIETLTKFKDSNARIEEYIDKA